MRKLGTLVVDSVVLLTKANDRSEEDLIQLFQDCQIIKRQYIFREKNSFMGCEIDSNGMDGNDLETRI